MEETTPDIYSFFASVEQELDASLRGKPVAVVPIKADTTCCIAVSYEGKACGVKTGTLVREARRLCPGMRFIVGDHANYVRYHNKILEAVDTCVPIDSVCSIDEIACRLTGRQRVVDTARALAAQVKAAIRAMAGASLRCSIGLGPNRFLGKIAGDILAVGVVLGGLVPEALHAPYLFTDGRRGRLLKTLDGLNVKYGGDALHYGATHESAGLVPLRIAFTRIPDETEL